MHTEASTVQPASPRGTGALTLKTMPQPVQADARIMIVDDEPINVMVLRRHLEIAGYRDIICLHDSVRAIDTIRAEKPDLLFVDIMMPLVSGLDILCVMQQDKDLSRIPAIVLTASSDPQTKIEALNLGANDFLQKPLDISELLPRARNALLIKNYMDHMESYSEQLEEQVLRRTAELAHSRREVIHCLAVAAEFRDDVSGRHVRRVGRYARIIAARLGWPSERQDLIEQAAQLHDVGKVGIADAILLKPGKLTPEEFEVIQQHCGIGKRIVEQLPHNETNNTARHTDLGGRILSSAETPVLQMAMRIALTHHERWDGAGYPLALRGDNIPIEGRITAVADVFDALSTARPYKAAFDLDKCFTIIQDGRGTQFDPACVDAFLRDRDKVIQVHRDLSDPA